MRVTSLFLFNGLLLMVSLLIAEACYIQNCPRGRKKRSLDDDSDSERECPSCSLELAGEHLTGTCFTANFCCHEDHGCFSNPEITSSCRSENRISTPCIVKGKICGSSRSGVCVTRGVCCKDEGSCHLDGGCSH